MLRPDATSTQHGLGSAFHAPSHPCCVDATSTQHRWGVLGGAMLRRRNIHATSRGGRSRVEGLRTLVTGCCVDETLADRVRFRGPGRLRTGSIRLRTEPNRLRTVVERSGYGYGAGTGARGHDEPSDVARVVGSRSRWGCHVIGRGGFGAGWGQAECSSVGRGARPRWGAGCSASTSSHRGCGPDHDLQRQHVGCSGALPVAVFEAAPCGSAASLPFLGEALACGGVGGRHGGRGQAQRMVGVVGVGRCRVSR